MNFSASLVAAKSSPGKSAGLAPDEHTFPSKHISVNLLLSLCSAALPIDCRYYYGSVVKLILSLIISIHPQVYMMRGGEKKGKTGIMKVKKVSSLIGLLAYCEDKICTFCVRPLLATHGAQRTK